MPSFLSDGIEIAYEVYGEGRPILLIHGFASSGVINWVNPGWVDALQSDGWQPITIDNRGHGGSRKLYDPKLYFAHEMADDAARLLDRLSLGAVPVMGYSMGARIAAFLAARHPARIKCAVWGGMGINLITGLEDSEEIIAALTADSLSEVPFKTDASREILIVPELMVEAGFCDWVRKESGPLFPRLMECKDPGDAAQKRLNRLIKDNTAEGELGWVFHALRHGKINSDRDNKVSQRLIMKQVGHEEAGVHPLYGSLTPDQMQDMATRKPMKGVDWGLLRQIDFETFATARPWVDRKRRIQLSID